MTIINKKIKNAIEKLTSVLREEFELEGNPIITVEENTSAHSFPVFTNIEMRIEYKGYKNEQ